MRKKGTRAIFVFEIIVYESKIISPTFHWVYSIFHWVYWLMFYLYVMYFCRFYRIGMNNLEYHQSEHHKRARENWISSLLFLPFLPFSGRRTYCRRVFSRTSAYSYFTRRNGQPEKRWRNLLADGKSRVHVEDATKNANHTTRTRIHRRKTLVGFVLTVSHDTDRLRGVSSSLRGQQIQLSKVVSHIFFVNYQKD